MYHRQKVFAGERVAGLVIDTCAGAERCHGALPRCFEADGVYWPRDGSMVHHLVYAAQQ